MPIHTIPSRDFSRDVGAAKRAAAEGPVFITDRGKPAYALLKIEDYYKLASKKPKSLLELMDALPGGDFDFEPPTLGGSVQAADLD